MPISTHFDQSVASLPCVSPLHGWRALGVQVTSQGLTQPATCPAYPPSHALERSSQTASLRVASGLHMCIVGLAGGLKIL